MCGIYAYITKNNLNVEEILNNALKIKHRGPDNTTEHILHRYTQRLWSWRDDFGGESVWAVALGEFVAANGADQLWPTIAAR